MARLPARIIEAGMARASDTTDLTTG